jgi:hypothetical protein
MKTKRSLIIGNSPMEEYYAKGFSKTERVKYFNPDGVYEDWFYVSQNPKLPTFIKEISLFFKALGIFAAGVVGAKIASYTPKKQEEEHKVAQPPH